MREETPVKSDWMAGVLLQVGVGWWTGNGSPLSATHSHLLLGSPAGPESLRGRRRWAGT